MTTRVGNVAGFSLHAGVGTRAHERDKLERLFRYITRPPVSTKRLSMTRNGRVRYELKTPWRNGTTHVMFEPLDFMFRTNGMSRAHGCAGATLARLVSLVPRPRVNLTRFHGVFAPNSKYRSRVTPANRGKRQKCRSVHRADQTPAEKRASMTWAKRLKRVFNIDVETCDKCNEGRLRSNLRMGLSYRNLDRLDDDQRGRITRQADAFLESLARRPKN